VCSDFADGRVAMVRRLGCRVMSDGVVRFATEVEVSVKFQPVKLQPTPAQEAAVP